MPILGEANISKLPWPSETLEWLQVGGHDVRSWKQILLVNCTACNKTPNSSSSKKSGNFPSHHREISVCSQSLEVPVWRLLGKWKVVKRVLYYSGMLLFLFSSFQLQKADRKKVNKIPKMMTKESSKITMNIKAENATNSDWQGYQISPVLCSGRGNRIIVLKFRPDENYEN